MTEKKDFLIKNLESNIAESHANMLAESDTIKRLREVISDCTAENLELKSQLAALQKRLDNAVELPCIEPMTTWDWDDTTGLGKTNFGKYWKVLYRDEDGEFIAYMGATKEEAEALLSELKGGRE